MRDTSEDLYYYQHDHHASTRSEVCLSIPALYRAVCSCPPPACPVHATGACHHRSASTHRFRMSLPPGSIEGRSSTFRTARAFTDASVVARSWASFWLLALFFAAILRRTRLLLQSLKIVRRSSMMEKRWETPCFSSLDLGWLGNPLSRHANTTQGSKDPDPTLV